MTFCCDRLRWSLETQSFTSKLNFRCTRCGEQHEGVPDLGLAAPYYYEQLSDEQKAGNATKFDDM